MKSKLIKFLNENKISLGMSLNNTELRFVNDIYGYGRFSIEHIKKNNIIYRVGGLWISEQERLEFDKDYFHFVDGAYFFQGGLDYILNGTHNHSCSPNAYLEDNTIRALRDIEPNEEITLDYSAFIVHKGIIFENCKCNSPECRKTVTGYDWSLYNLAKKYNNRVSNQIIRLSEDIQKNSDS